MKKHSKSGLNDGPTEALDRSVRRRDSRGSQRTDPDTRRASQLAVLVRRPATLAGRRSSPDLGLAAGGAATLAGGLSALLIGALLRACILGASGSPSRLLRAPAFRAATAVHDPAPRASHRSSYFFSSPGLGGRRNGAATERSRPPSITEDIATELVDGAAQELMEEQD